MRARVCVLADSFSITFNKHELFEVGRVYIIDYSIKAYWTEHDRDNDLNDLPKVHCLEFNNSIDYIYIYVTITNVRYYYLYKSHLNSLRSEKRFNKCLLES